MTSTTQQTNNLLTELQSKGVRLVNPEQDQVSRRGGAGPSDHQAMVIEGNPLMIPVHTQSVISSPFTLQPQSDKDKSTVLLKNGIPVKNISFANQPNFYELTTDDGIPYSHIATLHSTDVLATTVLQTCIRYGGLNKTCKFCSIGQSLAAGRTVAHKTPQQLADVAKAAVELDGVKHMVMTTGTPSTPDRGARVLCESVIAVKRAVDLPIQVQCEPPKELTWLEKLKDAGADSLGLHLEVVTPELRQHIMPSKARITLNEYMDAFEFAVPLFGWGQVSTYILAGLGDSVSSILSMCEKLVKIGVYPFVVPFVPIRGTPLEDHPPPSPQFMREILAPLGKMISDAGMSSEEVKAGCAKCGACSSLSRYEKQSSEVLEEAL